MPVILRPRLEPLGRRVGRRIETWHVDALEQLAPAVQDADVRSVKLVRGAGEEITSHLAHVDRLVRREVDRVDEHERAGGVGDLSGAADVGDRA
jgi:hypothetical protein